MVKFGSAAIEGGGGGEANPIPVCSLIYDVPGKKVVLDEFFCFLKCFSCKNIENIIPNCLK